MKKYIKPAISLYDVAPTSIMAGSVQLAKKTRIGISSFFTDDDDWSEGQQGQGTYNFWD